MPPKEAIKGSLNLAAAGCGLTGRGRLAGALRADISRPRIVNFMDNLLWTCHSRQIFRRELAHQLRQTKSLFESLNLELQDEIALKTERNFFLFWH
jgi:hypothetical protein